MVVAGTAYPEAENGLNIGRQIAIKSGLPVSVAGITVNQFCASSQQAAMMIHDSLALGKGKAGIALGGLCVEDLILFFLRSLTVRRHSYLESGTVF